MPRKNDEEKLKELEEKIEQIKNQKQLIENRLKEKERKARTKRLIEIGAEFEKYFGKGMTKEEAEKIALFLEDYVAEHKATILCKSKIEIEDANKRRRMREVEKKC